MSETYIEILPPPAVVETEQFDGTNNPFGAIEIHQCSYRMCPICGGANEKTFVIPQKGLGTNM